MICSVGPSRPTSNQDACWIEQEPPGSSLTPMGRERQPGNAPYLRPMTFPRPFADWMTCALLATEAANAGRLFVPAQPFLRPIVTNGSAVLETGGTGDIERNCAKDSLSLASIWLHASFRKIARCCGSM